MPKRNPDAQVLDDDGIADFGEDFEKPARATRRQSAVRTVTKGEPAWKRRNREVKHRGVQFRCSDSQLDLLQAASIHQEKSMQKILEAIVWPVLEERYGVTTEDSPS
jgi:hypothetical protein